MALAPGFQGGSLLSITAGGGVAQGGAGRPITSLGGLSMMAGADVSPFDPQTGLPTRPAGTFAEAAQFAFQQNQFVNQLAQRARAQAEATIQQALGLVQRGGPGSLAVLTSPLFTQLANIRGQVTFQPFDFTAGLQQPSPFFGGGIGGIRNLAAERRQGLIPQKPSPFGFQDFGGQQQDFGGQFQGFGGQQQVPDIFFGPDEQAAITQPAPTRPGFPVSVELPSSFGFDPNQAQGGLQTGTFGLEDISGLFGAPGGEDSFGLGFLDPQIDPLSPEDFFAGFPEFQRGAI